MSKRDTEQTAKTRITLDERTSVHAPNALEEAFDARTVIIKKPMAPPPTGLETTNTPSHKRASSQTERDSKKSSASLSQSLGGLRATLSAVPTWALIATAAALFLFVLSSMFPSRNEADIAPVQKPRIVEDLPATEQQEPTQRAHAGQNTLTEVLAHFDQSYTRSQTEMRKRQDQR